MVRTSPIFLWNMYVTAPLLSSAVCMHVWWQNLLQAKADISKDEVVFIKQVNALVCSSRYSTWNLPTIDEGLASRCCCFVSQSSCFQTGICPHHRKFGNLSCSWRILQSSRRLILPHTSWEIIYDQLSTEQADKLCHFPQSPKENAWESSTGTQRLSSSSMSILQQSKSDHDDTTLT